MKDGGQPLWSSGAMMLAFVAAFAALLGFMLLGR